MTEEEKEAIEQFKSWRNYIIDHKEITENTADLEFYIRTVLNLITKLQKENEELQKQYISKDKIRELITERQFKLQQEYKDFKDDIRLNTLQEIYYLGDGIHDRR